MCSACSSVVKVVRLISSLAHARDDIKYKVGDTGNSILQV